MLLGLFRFRVAGLCGLCCLVVLIPGASILLLGLFFWFAGFVAGGLCGFRCDTGVGRWLWVDGCVGKEMNILFE